MAGDHITHHPSRYSQTSLVTLATNAESEEQQSAIPLASQCYTLEMDTMTFKLCAYRPNTIRKLSCTQEIVNGVDRKMFGKGGHWAVHFYKIGYHGASCQLKKSK